MTIWITSLGPSSCPVDRHYWERNPSRGSWIAWRTLPHQRGSHPQIPSWSHGYTKCLAAQKTFLYKEALAGNWKILTIELLLDLWWRIKFLTNLRVLTNFAIHREYKLKSKIRNAAHGSEYLLIIFGKFFCMVVCYGISIQTNYSSFGIFSQYCLCMPSSPKSHIDEQLKRKQTLINIIHGWKGKSYLWTNKMNSHMVLK